MLLCSILCLIRCIHYSKYIPDPEKDIELWVANFSQQRSFSYRYTMHTSYVHTFAKGTCVIDRGETVQGTWQQEGRELTFKYIGIQDREYSKQDGEWVVASRGEQSDVLTQIERLFKFDKFEYQGMNGVYQYHFKANIPFLAPGRWKEMIGILEISTRTYLPLKIWAGLPDSSVSWTIDLYKYNKTKKIDVPSVPWYTYEIQGADADHTRHIKKRLRTIDIDFRLEQKKEELLLSAPEYYTIDDIQSFLQNHTITIYRVTREKGKATRIEYIRGDKTKALYCAETLFTESDIKKVSIKYDPAYRPVLIIKLFDKTIMPEEIAVAIDGVIQDVVTLDSDKKINTLLVYTNMHYFELQLVKAAILYDLPELKVNTFSGESR